MHKLTVIQFTDSERRLLREITPILYVRYPDPTKQSEDSEAFRVLNALQDIVPMPLRRLEKARDFLVPLELKIVQESSVDYWRKQAEEEGTTPEELGDPKNPLSAAYMAKVLAEARQGMFLTVQRIIRMIEEAIELTSPDPGREKHRDS